MITLTVYFDDPWWVGVFEVADGDALRVARHVFGGEPSGPELLHFVLHHFINLIERATPSDAAPEPSAQRINPKRAAREAARATQSHGASTMAQAALRIQIEAHKRERRIVTREQREQEAEDKRRKAREKALARRRGH